MQKGSFMIAFIATSAALLSGLATAKWDGLLVTWGQQPGPDVFVSMPTTVDEALLAGFTQISHCSNYYPWRGARYVKGNDYSVILLFDIKGNIAGIQTGVPKYLSDGYPPRTLRPPFVNDGQRWVVSAYFTDPSQICTVGRSNETVANDGVGTNLYLQFSHNPEQSTLIPSNEMDLVGTKWTKGKCFPTMGMHYWWDTSVNMDCDRAMPAFLLYNGGSLNAFGWALNTNLTSIRYEHPTPPILGMFMNVVPRCLLQASIFTTMHIFLTNDVNLNQC